VYAIDFSDIQFVASYQAAPWWGRGEAISFTAIPRTKGGKIGSIHDVRVRNVTGRAENSVRINGTPESRIRDVTLDHVDVDFDRWTKYPGAVFDNRPTTAYPDIEPHNTPAISVRYADKVAINDCTVGWRKNRPSTFGEVLETENVTGVTSPRLHVKSGEDK